MSIVFGHSLSYKEARLCEEKRASHQQEPQFDCGVGCLQARKRQCYLGVHVAGMGEQYKTQSCTIVKLKVRITPLGIVSSREEGIRSPDSYALW